MVSPQVLFSHHSPSIVVNTFVYRHFCQPFSALHPSPEDHDTHHEPFQEEDGVGGNKGGRGGGGHPAANRAVVEMGVIDERDRNGSITTEHVGTDDGSMLVQGEEGLRGEFGIEVNEADTKVNIVQSSLFCLSVDNALRHGIVRIVYSQWFAALVLAFIIINSLALALDDPGLSHLTWLRSVLVVLDYIFLGFFAVEMILKIMAHGLILHSKAYLRSAWNILDCIVVIAGFVNIFWNAGSGVSALRVVRVLRPLRTVSRVRSLKHILTKLVDSMPRMADVFLLLCFVTWMFAVVGVQFFMGLLHHRCYANLSGNTTNPVWTLVDNDTKICSASSLGYQCEAEGNGVYAPQVCTYDRSKYAGEILNFDNVLTAILLTFKIECRDNWPDDANDLANGMNQWTFIYCFVVTLFCGYFCVNLFVAVLSNEFSKDSPTDDDDDIFDEHKFVSFAALLGASSLSPPLVVACCANSHIMKEKDDKEDLEALNDDANMQDIEERVMQEDEEEEEEEKENEDSNKEKRKAKKEEDLTVIGFSSGPSSHQADFDEDRGEGGTEFFCNSSILHDERKLRLQQKELLDHSCFAKVDRFFKIKGCPPMGVFVQSAPYQVVVMIVIVLNALVLSMDYYGAPEAYSNFITISTLVFNILFIVDAIFKIMGLGPSYFRDESNVADFILCLLSIPDVISASSSPFSALRAFRLIRLLRLARRWENLQKLLNLVVVSLKSVASLSLVALIIIYIYTILGFQLVNNDLPGMRFSFANVFDSFLTVFVIVTGENWASIMKRMMLETGWWNVFYILTLVIFGNFTLTNLFIAIILENFAAPEEEEEDDEDEEEQQHDDDSNGAAAVASRTNAHHPGGGHKRSASSESSDEGTYESVMYGSTNTQRRTSGSSHRRTSQGDSANHPHSQFDPHAVNVNDNSKTGASPLGDGSAPPPRRRSRAMSVAVPLTRSNNQAPSAGTQRVQIAACPISSDESDEDNDDEFVALNRTTSFLNSSVGGGNNRAPTPLAGNRRMSELTDQDKRRVERVTGIMFHELVEIGKEEQIRSGEEAATGPSKDTMRTSTRSEGTQGGSFVAGEGANSEKFCDDRVDKEDGTAAHMGIAPQCSPAELSTKQLVKSGLLRSYVVERNIHKSRLVGDSEKLTEAAALEVETIEKDRVAQQQKQRRYGNVLSAIRTLLARTAETREGQSYSKKKSTAVDSYVLAEPRRRRYRTTTEKEAIVRQWIGLRYSSFFCLKPEICIRRILGKILQNIIWEWFMIFMTVASSIFLALDRPNLQNSDPQMAQAIFITDIIFAVIFGIEFFMKITALGAFAHPGSYFRSAWNWIDFIVVVTSILSLFYDFFKVGRALRVLRLTNLSYNLQVIITALISSIPGMSTVLVLLFFLWWVYAVLGVALFKGLFYECNDPEVDRMGECVGNYTAVDYLGFNETFSYVDERRWYPIRRSSTFDNIFYAFYSLFKLSLSDGWFEMMYWAVDRSSIGDGVSHNKSPHYCLFFISFMIFGNFFSVNLFTGVLVDRFVKQRDNGEGFNLISASQKKWVLVQKVLFRSSVPIRPQPPKYCFLLGCFRIAENKWFDRFFFALILLNCLLVSLYYFGMDQDFRDALFYSLLAILILFTIEAFIKICGYNPKIYFRNNWNRLDFLIVIASWIGFAVGLNSIAPIFRVLRLLLLIRELKGLQTIFISLYQALPELLNVSIVLIVGYFLFAYVGVFVFYNVKKTGPLNDMVNFDDVWHAFITLYIATTTEGWAEMADACNIGPPDCEPENDNCGTWFSIVYFMLFMIIMSFIMMNLLVTVVIEAFSEAEVEENEEASLELLTAFRDRWVERDPTASKRLHVSIVLKLLPTLPNSVWDRSSLTSKTQKLTPWICTLRQLEKLHVPIDVNSEVYYKDVIASLALRLFGISVTDGIIASQRTRHGITWKPNRFSIHHYHAAKLLTIKVRKYIRTRAERLLRAQLRDLRDQHSAVVELELNPLRRSHKEMTAITRWLLERQANAIVTGEQVGATEGLALLEEAKRMKESESSLKGSTTAVYRETRFGEDNRNRSPSTSEATVRRFTRRKASVTMQGIGTPSNSAKTQDNFTFPPPSLQAGAFKEAPEEETDHDATADEDEINNRNNTGSNASSPRGATTATCEPSPRVTVRGRANHTLPIVPDYGNTVTPSHSGGGGAPAAGGGSGEVNNTWKWPPTQDEHTGTSSSNYRSNNTGNSGGTGWGRGGRTNPIAAGRDDRGRAVLEPCEDSGGSSSEGF